MQKPYIRQAVNGAEGDGAEVNRLFPMQQYMNFDPFVLWDDFSIAPGAGFPDHPHRGFEGITYVFEGSINHKDNLGNDSTVASGGLQRFTAGKGIIHSEMPSTQGATHGIQMWLNLPRELKKIEPDYQQVNAEAIPEIIVGDARVRVLAGEDAPLKLKTPARYLDVELEPEGVFEQVMPAEFRGFVYMVKGSAVVDVLGEHQSLVQHSAIFYPNAASVKLVANEACRFMVCFGQPHGEPIYQHGPYVD